MMMRINSVELDGLGRSVWVRGLARSSMVDPHLTRLMFSIRSIDRRRCNLVLLSLLLPVSIMRQPLCPSFF